jgi:asparagine synthase (glutamine-hydrolysing)
MSIIFGIRRPPNAVVTEAELLHVAAATKRYALDGVSVRSLGRVGMGFQPYYTHLRSNLESTPVCDNHGNLVTIDGRLDNYQDLCHELDLDPRSTADSAIVLAGFERWQGNCFSRLIGDWAIALWSRGHQALYLARDHAGARTLYLQLDGNTVRWSSYLETFFIDGASMPLDLDYAACYLACQPVRERTPYKGIQSVLPAHYLVIRGDTTVTTSHWEWMKKQTIEFTSDSEYEEQFLTLFKQSVDRRAGPGAPILAQLSGGMDSSSIVCMSDYIRRSASPSGELLDTVSFYDDSEPSWDEKPYFSAVEARRGKVGTHIESSFLDRTFEPHSSSEGGYLLPGPDSSSIKREHRYKDTIGNDGYRVVLSGIGGDEVLGGVPTALPELADYLALGEIGLLLNRSLAWCLIDRTPLVEKVWGTISFLLRLYRKPRPKLKIMPPWLRHTFYDRRATINKNDRAHGKPFGFSPHAINNGTGWWSVMESMPHLAPGLLSRPEYRYPYLDRDLVDYLFRIPREQLIRPGQRRSLMRRALCNIVPSQVLERRRKAYTIRGSLCALQHSHLKIDTLFSKSILASYKLISPRELRSELQSIIEGRNVQWCQALLRAVALELWLRSGSGFANSYISRLDRASDSTRPPVGKQDPCNTSLHLT